jgi:DNA-binding NarL/FixJ family response regulator
MKTKIALVDDHQITREPLALYLNRHSNYEVIMEAGDGKTFIDQIRKSQVLPDIVVLDLMMPVMDGFEVALWLQQYHKYIQVLVLTMSHKYGMIARLLQLGVKGILSKEDNLEELENALNTLRQRKIYMNRHVTGSMFKEHLNDKTAKEDMERITNAEFRFLRLCCSELTYSAIAERMYVSPRTVESYRDSLFEKFNIRSRYGLIMFACRKGIIDLEGNDPVMYLGSRPEY